VALALVGLDAVHDKCVRVDTWTENISQEGFRLHVRTWGDSILPFVKVAWVAASAYLGVTTQHVAPHSPPKEYISLGPSLGQGVMGVTHRTRNVVDGQIYAVKTCKHPYADHKESLRRELSNLALLPRHPNLLRYYTNVLEADRLHIVTEYLDAFNFAELLPAPDGIYPCKHPSTTILKWMLQLLDGVAHMHQAGIMHRDLHRENVLVLRDPRNMKRPSQNLGAIRIIDFGAGKVSDLPIKERFMSEEAGFAQYASPQRRRGEPFNDRDDVWAVGCHLVELYTGRAIRKRHGCGFEGADFATTPYVVRNFIQECGSDRCRETAEFILIANEARRPSAASARDYVRAVLRPATPAPPVPTVWVTVERPERRGQKRQRAMPNGGGRMTRQRSSLCFT
jgi:serine/threonine protein kinase